jgi:hypothetical protein
MDPSGIKREHSASKTVEAVAAPATVSGETTPLMITGRLGRSAFVVDPLARRSAIARAADLRRVDA